MIIGGFLFFSGYCVGSNIGFKKMVLSFLVVVVWSLGFLILPVPEGYAEAVYGSWAILLMVIAALYFRREESKKKKLKEQASRD